jgi:hypothetical protein
LIEAGTDSAREVRMSLAQAWYRGGRNGLSRARRRRLHRLEQLEDRRLLSAAGRTGHAAAVATVWNVHGTRSSDVVIIDRNPAIPEDLRVFRNAALLGERPASEVKAIHVSTGAGNDVVRVDESVGPIAVRLVVDAGPGNDRVTGGSGRNVLHAGSGISTLGGPGDNVIVGASSHARVLKGTAYEPPHTLHSLRSLRAYLADAYKLQQGAGAGGRRKYSGSNTPTRGTFVGAPPAAPTSGTTSSAPSHSTTNNQVQGVNEADIVETDGNNLYILTQQDLVIVAAQPASTMAVASKTTIEGYPVAMFLDGTQVQVISQVYPDTVSGSSDTLTPAEYLASTQTKITDFDVTDPTAPRVTSETYLDGYYVDARQTGGATYLVVQNDVLGALAPPTGDGSGGAAVLASLSGSAIDQVLPTFDVKIHGPSGVQDVKGLLTKPSEILGSIPTDDDSLVSVVELGAATSTPGPAHTVSVFTPWVSTVYASPTSLYLLTPDDTQNDETTTIDKFALGAAGPTLVATGEVPGAVYDQYSVDESGPYLRIATSLDQFAADGTDQTSTGVYVLTQQGSNLVVTGSLASIAPDSSIDTARFVGDRAYLTTFGDANNTPLMVVDLTDPSALRLAGTLNDPAATSFLEPVDATHLVGIGRIPDASDTSSDQLELTLYDVSNPAGPAIVGTTILDDGSQGYAYSEAEYDPHALSYFPEYNVLAVPVTRVTFDTSGSSGGGAPVPVAAPSGVVVDPLRPINFQITSSLVVLSIDPTSGLTEFGSVTHTSDVLRSVRIGNVVYSITNYDVQANQVATGLPAVAGVTIEPQSNP